jgi:hypothetical protein
MKSRLNNLRLREWEIPFGFSDQIQDLLELAGVRNLVFGQEPVPAIERVRARRDWVKVREETINPNNERKIFFISASHN